MIENVVLAIGTERFSKVLFDEMGRSLSLRQVVIHRYSSEDDVEPLAAEDCQGGRNVRRLVDRYIREYHRRDPLRTHLSCPVRRREVFCKVLRVDREYDDDYRRNLFGAPGIVDKLSILIRHPDNAIAVSFYRGRESGPFRQPEVEKVERHMQVLAAAVERHFALSGPGPAYDVSVLARNFAGLALPAPLSQRESAVCARILMGYSNEAIALDLDISFHSVATYRRRAYSKLNITSQNELFALVLAGSAPTRFRQLGH